MKTVQIAEYRTREECNATVYYNTEPGDAATSLAES